MHVVGTELRRSTDLKRSHRLPTSLLRLKRVGDRRTERVISCHRERPARHQPRPIERLQFSLSI